MSKKSPTMRTLEHLREQGYLCAVVEKFNPHVGPHGIRQDLFGLFDVLAIRDNETLGVQCTSAGVAERVRKITESEHLAQIRKANWRIEVHGWTKRANNRYALRVEDLS